MNIDALKMFIMIAKKGSISAAASELGYAQSNISTRVQNLENDLQTQLFYRNPHGVTLTSSGEELYVRAIKIVSLSDDTVNKLHHPKEFLGSLKIGTLQTAASTFLPSLLSKYHTKNPNVELTIETGTTLASAQKVLNYQLDGAIIGGTVNEPDLISIPLMDEDICIVTSSDDGVDIKNDSLLVFPSGCAYRNVLETWLNAQNVVVHHPIEFNYLNAIIASVSAGLGISVLPKRIVQPYVDSDALNIVDLPQNLAKLPISFIFRKDYVVNQSFDQFKQIIRTKKTV